jgi:hypothetical protein
MALTITIKLSDVQQKALEHVAYSAQDWAENVVYERCRIAIEDIAKKEIDQKMASGEPISGTKEDLVLAANIKSAKEITDNLEQSDA